MNHVTIILLIKGKNIIYHNNYNDQMALKPNLFVKKIDLLSPDIRELSKTYISTICANCQY